MIHKAEPGDEEGESLDEAFAIVATHPSCRMNLDLKSIANVPAVDKLLDKYGIKERAFFTGVDEKWVKTVKAVSAVPYYLNHFLTPGEAKNEKDALALIAKIKETGALGLNSNFLNASKFFVDLARENGVLVSFWTPNTKCEMKCVLKTYPDNITTEHPDVLAELIENL